MAEKPEDVKAEKLPSSKKPKPQWDESLEVPNIGPVGEVVRTAFSTGIGAGIGWVARRLFTNSSPYPIAFGAGVGLGAALAHGRGQHHHKHGPGHFPPHWLPHHPNQGAEGHGYVHSGPPQWGPGGTSHPPPYWWSHAYGVPPCGPNCPRAGPPGAPGAPSALASDAAEKPVSD